MAKQAKYTKALDLVALAIQEAHRGNKLNASKLVIAAARHPSSMYALQVIEATNGAAMRGRRLRAEAEEDYEDYDEDEDEDIESEFEDDEDEEMVDIETARVIRAISEVDDVDDVDEDDVDLESEFEDLDADEDDIEDIIESSARRVRASNRKGSSFARALRRMR